MRETEVTLAAIGASLTLFRHDGTPSSPPPPGADWLGISGYTLLIAGCAGCLLKYWGY